MSVDPFKPSRSRIRIGARAASLVLSLAVLVAVLVWRSLGARPVLAPPVTDLAPLPSVPEASRAEVDRACGKCHALPEPETFPKSLWPHEVERGFHFLHEDEGPADIPSVAGVIAYYRNRAPEVLPVLGRPVESGECPVRFDRAGYRPAPGLPSPGVSNVRFVHLSDPRKLDVVACDMRNGKVFLLKPYESAPELKVVSDAIPHPAHAEVVDLDGDGIKDLVVANLGSLAATDDRVGSVVWLKGEAGGSFVPRTLADGLGRVADVQAADFDGDGDLDLIVAEFGWLKTGSIRLLENRTTDAGRPVFVPSTIDTRHGAIHVPVADLDGDGRPDFVALISQEHETVVAFLNIGGHRFQPQVIYAAPHPAFGSSGIQLVDLDGDADLDVLMTNGDSLDSRMLRPYHGVQWLENRGSYPFRCHRLTSLYGAHRAVAARPRRGRGSRHRGRLLPPGIVLPGTPPRDGAGCGHRAGAGRARAVRPPLARNRRVRPRHLRSRRFRRRRQGGSRHRQLLRRARGEHPEREPLRGRLGRPVEESRSTQDLGHEPGPVDPECDGPVGFSLNLRSIIAICWVDRNFRRSGLPA